MKIIKIEKLKNNKYKIIFDRESIITFDNVILDNGLLYKTDVTMELYDSLIKDTMYYDIYNKVIKYILKKRRSEKQVREYLIKLNLNEKDIEKMVLKLKNSNLINDIDYCKAYINDNIYLSNKGINKIKTELLNQQIPIETIQKEFDNISNDLMYDKLEKIINKKINLNKKYSNNYFKQKLLNELLELGYDRQDILDIINNNLTNNDYLILQKEFEKVYSKLEKKYEGYTLIKNVKSKMLSKGFNISDIDNLLKQKTEK